MTVPAGRAPAVSVTSWPTTSPAVLERFSMVARPLVRSPVKGAALPTWSPLLPFVRPVAPVALPIRLWPELLKAPTTSGSAPAVVF